MSRTFYAKVTVDENGKTTDIAELDKKIVKVIERAYKEERDSKNVSQRIHQSILLIEMFTELYGKFPTDYVDSGYIYNMSAKIVAEKEGVAIPTVLSKFTTQMNLTAVEMQDKLVKYARGDKDDLIETLRNNVGKNSSLADNKAIDTLV